VIDEIKQIPYYHRKYDSTTQEWSIVNIKEYREAIQKLETYSFDTQEGNKYARDFLRQFYI